MFVLERQLCCLWNSHATVGIHCCVRARDDVVLRCLKTPWVKCPQGGLCTVPIQGVARGVHDCRYVFLNFSGRLETTGRPVTSVMVLFDKTYSVPVDLTRRNTMGYRPPKSSFKNPNQSTEKSCVHKDIVCVKRVNQTQ